MHGCQGNVIASNKVGNEEQKELVYENKTIWYLIIVMLWKKGMMIKWSRLFYWTTKYEGHVKDK